MPDLDRLNQVLQPGRPLTVPEVVMLAYALETQSAARARRLNLRDDAIRAALAAVAGASPTAAACKLERLLRRYLGGPGWAARRVGGPSPLDCMVHRIAETNEGQPISWGQLARIGRGRRTPT